MSLNLTIDQGNSAAKVCLWEGDRLLSYSHFHTLDTVIIDSIIDDYAPVAAIYCSVADQGDDVTERMADRGVRVVRLTADTPLPLTIGYRSPGTLGTDRVAAAVGAWAAHPGRDILVADLGTAITYDVVRAGGRYAGGNIAPGVRMRLEALNRFTARLPMVEADDDTPLWGDTTATALKAGAVNGVVGELTYYRSRLPHDTVTMLTGGDSRLIAPRLGFAAETRPHLVSEGLNSILRYNENI